MRVCKCTLGSLAPLVLSLLLFWVLPATAQTSEAQIPAGGILLFGPEGQPPAGGDLLYAWRRGEGEGAAHGAFLTPFDLALALVEEQPKGGFSVEIGRGGERLWVAWPPSARKLMPGLPLAGELGEEQASAFGRLLNKDASAVPLLEALSLREEIDPRSRAYYLSQVAQLLRRLGMQERIPEFLDKALELLPSEASAERAFLLDAKGLALEQRGDLEGAERLVREAMGLKGGEEAATLGVARNLTTFGRIAWTRGDLPAARGHLQAALALRSRLAPGSLDEADSLNDVAIILWRLGDLKEAEARLSRCLSVQEVLAPQSPEVARSLNNLGLVAFERGDLSRAEQHFLASLAIREAKLPNHPDTAQGLHNLGVVMRKRGDLAGAERYFRRSLEIETSLASKSLGAAQTVTSLAILAAERADLDNAWDLAHEALSLYEAVAPESLDLAEGLETVAMVAKERREYEEGLAFATRSLALRRSLAPGSPQEARGWSSEGELRLEMGQPGRAVEAFAAELAIWDRLAPESTTRASTLTRLGLALRATGDQASAEARLREALDLSSRLLPGGIEEAEASHAFGLLLRDSGRKPAALTHFFRALECLDACALRAGESEESRSGFRSRFTDYYTDALGLLVEMGRPEEGFAVLERSRARGMLEILSGRELAFAGEMPEELDAERRRLDARGATLREDLSARDGEADTVGAEALRAELRALARRRGEVQTEIRRASPRIASLLDPRPLDLAGAQAALPPGTLLLAYAVGEKQTTLFALGPARGEFAAHLIPVGRRTLDRRIRRFRGIIWDRSQSDDAPLALGRDLLGPVAQAMGRAKHLVICPDGPLHTVPFSALLVEGGGRDPRRLAQICPMTTVLSATVYAELRAEHLTGAGRIVAFADPDYGSAGRLARLPHTREEVGEIQSLYAGEAAVFLGTSASEPKVREVASTRAASLHLACHAFSDDRFPLDSGLALSTGMEGGDDGVLRAYEVLESVRIGADRVVLSACATALGKRVGGEGTVGLVRAFQFAGAKTVLASLWPVSDAATSELMRRFYRHLKRGRSADEALRRAQVELLSGKAGASLVPPDAWASFQLHGDGR